MKTLLRILSILGAMVVVSGVFYLVVESTGLGATGEGGQFQGQFGEEGQRPAGGAAGGQFPGRGAEEGQLPDEGAAGGQPPEWNDEEGRPATGEEDLSGLSLEEEQSPVEGAAETDLSELGLAEEQSMPGQGAGGLQRPEGSGEDQQPLTRPGSGTPGPASGQAWSGLLLTLAKLAGIIAAVVAIRALLGFLTRRRHPQAV